MRLSRVRGIASHDVTDEPWPAVSKDWVGAVAHDSRVGAEPSPREAVADLRVAQVRDDEPFRHLLSEGSNRRIGRGERLLPRDGRGIIHPDCARRFVVHEVERAGLFCVVEPCEVDEKSRSKTGFGER